jgi:hypothetical protein
MEKKHIIIIVAVIAVAGFAYWWFKMRPASKSGFDGNESNYEDGEEFAGEHKKGEDGGIGAGKNKHHEKLKKSNYEDGEEGDNNFEGHASGNKSFGGNLSL